MVGELGTFRMIDYSTNDVTTQSFHAAKDTEAQAEFTRLLREGSEIQGCERLSYSTAIYINSSFHTPYIDIIGSTFDVEPVFFALQFERSRDFHGRIVLVIELLACSNQNQSV